MTTREKRELIACVREGVRQALMSLKLIEERPHPKSGDAVRSDVIARFLEQCGE